MVATSAMRLVIASWLSPIHWRVWPQTWTRCMLMLGDGWRMFVGSIFFTVVWQGDNLILGMWHGQEQVGIYSIAFQLSLQGLALLTDNLAGVLLPVMGHMSGDAARQRDGFLRALRYLCLIGVPLCFIQGALAEPLLRLFWHDKWVAATRPLQALCVGMAFQLIGVPSTQFLLAQGRLATYMKTAVLSAVGLVIAVTCAVQFGAATSVAVAVAGIYLIMNACIAGAALGKRGSGIPLMLSGFPEVARVMAVPLLSGLIGGMVGYEVGQWTMHRQGPLLALVAGSSAGLAASILVIATVSRELTSGSIGLIRSLINRQPAS
jgi:O-antigen/teichoic acid export membrane protein